jgi:plasmid stabilization system protein ParE
VTPAIAVRRLAEAELAEAKAWYDLQVPGLGDAFLDQFRHSALAIAEGPQRWPVYHGQVRRYVMSRFPYVVYFDVRPGKIRILRVVHTSKDPVAVRELFDT